MQKLLLSIFMTLIISGCSVLGVYKVDIPQGAPLTQQKAAQVKIGMTPQQVRFLLGTPTVSDPLNPLRWDYIYNYVPGTYAKKAGIPVAQGQHLRIYFNESGVVSQIEGLETIPESQPGLPGSKEAILTAPKL